MILNPSVLEKITNMRKGQKAPWVTLRNLTNNPAKKGKENYQWKEEGVGYRTIHDWIRREMGNPNECTRCGAHEVKKIRTNIQWANISREYRRDVNDWIALCVSCHLRIDKNNLPVTI